MAPKAKEAKQEQDPDGRREAEEAVEKNIEREKVVQPLKCEFTPEELLDLADEMTQKMDTREKKQSEFDSIKKQYNGELSTLDEEVRVKQRLIRDKYEFRSIPCQVERDYNTRTFLGNRRAAQTARLRTPAANVQGGVCGDDGRAAGGSSQ